MSSSRGCFRNKDSAPNCPFKRIMAGEAHPVKPERPSACMTAPFAHFCSYKWLSPLDLEIVKA